VTNGQAAFGNDAAVVVAVADWFVATNESTAATPSGTLKSVS
jgi:hypothetical protein